MNEESHSTLACCCSVTKSMRIEQTVFVACIRGKRHTHGASVSESEGKRPLRRPRCRSDDNIKTDLKEIDWEGVDWIHLAQDVDKVSALVSTVMNIFI